MLPLMLDKLFKSNSLLCMVLIPLSQILMAKLQWTMLCKCCTPWSRLVKNMNILANNCILYDFVSVHVFHTVLQFSDSVDSASLSRKTRKCACSDLCKFFISTPKTAEKKPTNFHRNCGLGQLRFLSKIVNLFHNNMQV